MEMIIPPTYYTLNPSTKSITLLAPYNSWTVERIKSIRNLTKQILIYEATDPKHYTSMQSSPAQPFDISITNGAITYISASSMSTTDKLQIVIDTEVVTSTGGGGGSSETTTLVPTTVYSSQSVSASATITSSGYAVGNCSKLELYFSNTGASTDAEITVYGSPTSDISLKKQIGSVVVLGANVTGGPVIGKDEIPSYISFSVSNKDATNAATVSIVMDEYVGSYTLTNTTILSSVSIAASGSTTSSSVSTAGARRVNVYCSQGGSSTSTTFYIYGTSSTSPTISKLIAMGTLGANSQWGCGILSDIISGSIYVTVANSDSSNAATATVLIESFT